MAKKKQQTTETAPLKSKDDFLEDIQKETSAFNDEYDEEVVESGASFHKFTDPGDEVIGFYNQPIIARETKQDLWEEGDTIGYELTVKDSGLQTIIPANYSVESAFRSIKKGDLVRVKFIEKIEDRSGGRSFSSFRITKLVKKNP